MKIKVLNQKLEFDIHYNPPRINFFEWDVCSTKELVELERLFGASVAEIRPRETFYQTLYVSVAMNGATTNLWEGYITYD